MISVSNKIDKTIQLILLCFKYNDSKGSTYYKKSLCATFDPFYLYLLIYFFTNLSCLRKLITIINPFVRKRT